MKCELMVQDVEIGVSVGELTKYILKVYPLIQPVRKHIYQDNVSEKFVKAINAIIDGKIKAKITIEWDENEVQS